MNKKECSYLDNMHLFSIFDTFAKTFSIEGYLWFCLKDLKKNVSRHKSYSSLFGEENVRLIKYKTFRKGLYVREDALKKYIQENKPELAHEVRDLITSLPPEDQQRKIDLQPACKPNPKKQLSIPEKYLKEL